MLVKLLRVFTWLAVIYAVEENVAMMLGAFSTTETPWSHIAGWFNPWTCPGLVDTPDRTKVR